MHSNSECQPPQQLQAGQQNSQRPNFWDSGSDHLFHQSALRENLSQPLPRASQEVGWSPYPGPRVKSHQECVVCATDAQIVGRFMAWMSAYTHRPLITARQSARPPEQPALSRGRSNFRTCYLMFSRNSKKQRRLRVFMRTPSLRS